MAGVAVGEGLDFSKLHQFSSPTRVANIAAGTAFNSSSACTSMDSGAYLANVYDGYNIKDNILGYLLSMVG
jgi:hypothetical protein